MLSCAQDGALALAGDDGIFGPGMMPTAEEGHFKSALHVGKKGTGKGKGNGQGQSKGKEEDPNKEKPDAIADMHG